MKVKDLHISEKLQEAKKKFLDKKHNPKSDEEKAAEALEKLAKSISNLKNKLLALTGSVKRSDALDELTFLVDFAGYLASESDILNAKMSKKLLTAKTKIYSIILAIKSGNATKVQINSKIKEVVLNLTISFDEDNSELNKTLEPLKKLENVKVDKSTTKIVVAPFLFSLPFPIDKSKLNRLESGFKLKNVLDFPVYYVCEKANWLVVSKKGLPNAILNKIKDKADSVLSFFSKKTATSLSAVHEISLDTVDWYAVLIVNKNIEGDVTEITNAILKPLASKKGTSTMPNTGMGNSRFTIYLE